MQTIYSLGKVCPPDQPAGSTEGCLALEPDLENIIASTRDYDELLRVWVGWRDAVGPKIGKLYPTYVQLKTEAAKIGGMTIMTFCTREVVDRSYDYPNIRSCYTTENFLILL